MGLYMGIFNMFIVIPQIVAATLLGLTLKALFDNQSIYDQSAEQPDRRRAVSGVGAGAKAAHDVTVAAAH